MYTIISVYRWVTRNEAGKIAFEAGQIPQPKYFFSEDLWSHPYPKYSFREIPEEDERY